MKPYLYCMKALSSNILSDKLYNGIHNFAHESDFGQRNTCRAIALSTFRNKQTIHTAHKLSPFMDPILPFFETV